MGYVIESEGAIKEMMSVFLDDHLLWFENDKKFKLFKIKV